MEPKYIGVQVQRSQKVATQVVRVVKKTYEMLSFIVCGIVHNGRDAMLQDIGEITPEMYCTVLVAML